MIARAWITKTKIASIVTAGLLMSMVSMSSLAAGQLPQSKLSPAKAEAAKKYPRIVLYSTSWCPHCKAAKEYLTKNNIPFINRDVEADSQAMELMTDKYNSRGVPLIVFGNGENEVTMKGFTPELFQATLKKSHMNK